MKSESIVVKYRTVTITVFPWSPRVGVTYWKFRHGKKHIVRAELAAAKLEAKRIAEQTYFGSSALGLTPSQNLTIRRLLQADPGLATVDEFLSWRDRQAPVHPLDAARTEFLAVKRANAGASPHHVRTLERHLGTLPTGNLSEIGLAQLPTLTGAPRSRKNRLDAWRAFFTWCRSRGYLPAGGAIVTDSIETPRIARGTPETWTPQELAILIANVQTQYLPWIALSAWAGMRTEEICPDSDSKKSPLLWSDFHWDRGLIIVRPETSKTGRRRVIPILPPIAALLPQDRVGRVGPILPPHAPPRTRQKAETTRLGLLVGGWRRNALRHSFLSYRAAIVGISQASQEAGNSESIARRVYEDAKGSDEAALWFLIPQEYPSKPESDLPPVSEIVLNP